MNTKLRLLQVGKKQIDLVDYLQKNGYPAMCPQTMSAIISGRLNTPQAYSVRREIDRLLTQWEKEQEVQ